MIKVKLITDLKEIVESAPDEIDEYGIKYYLFSVEEIKGIIDVLENQ